MDERELFKTVEGCVMAIVSRGCVKVVVSRGCVIAVVSRGCVTCDPYQGYAISNPANESPPPLVLVL